MPYEHLTEQERYVICHMKLGGFKQVQIARQLERSPGTISRELRRNRGPVEPHYLYDSADRLARQRRSAANRRYKLDEPALGDYVRQALVQHWSPQQIAGRLKRDHPDDLTRRVTHEAIYQWIYRRVPEGWHRLLRHRRPKRRKRLPGRGKRGQIPGRIGIEHRPAVVETRQRFGDWEADTLQGAKGRGGLATHVERRSRFLLTAWLTDQQAPTFTGATIAAFRSIPARLRRTMTCDNGKEFTHFPRLEQRLGLRVYFARPYAAWERGSNENTNGLLREFFPKGTDFHQISRHRVAKVTRLINNRPRKCLNYRTPAEVLSALPGVALRN